MTDDATTLATIPAPWARDAHGADVPTHYKVAGNTLVQVVDHVGSDAAYPILADPSFKLCNFYTAACVTFTKSEVRAISASWAAGVGAGIATTCSLVPWSPWYLAAVRLTCTITIGARAAEFVVALRGAQQSGRCLEVKWSVVATLFLSGTKAVSC